MMEKPVQSPEQRRRRLPNLLDLVCPVLAP
jgi:hypothetical protein